MDEAVRPSLEAQRTLPATRHGHEHPSWHLLGEVVIREGGPVGDVVRDGGNGGGDDEGVLPPALSGGTGYNHILPGFDALTPAFGPELVDGPTEGA